jgi:4-amino-4-deoxy-L-arabinose transferase-like glycosyltransferase
VSAILKTALALVFADMPAHYDEAEFLAYGRAIETGAPPQIWRAPGYQWFIAAGLNLAGGRVVGVRLLQVILSVLTSWIVYRIGRKRWGERAGFWSGTFFAFYPSLVAFSHLLWSETLYIFLVVAATDRLLELDERSRWRDAVFAGLFIGAATLTRSLGIAVAGASCAWLIWGRWTLGSFTRAITRAIVVGVVSAAVVIPWTIEASKRAGTFVATDLNGGFNFWLGHDEYIAPDLPSNWIVGIGLDANMGSRYFDFLPDSIWRQAIFDRLARAGIPQPFGPEGVRWFRDDAWREIRAHPGAAIARFPKKVAALWAPDFFLPRHLARDWYGRAPTSFVFAIWFLTWATAAIPLIVGPAALASMRADRFRSLAVFWIATYVFVHGLAYGHTRMHQPLVPLLVLGVAACLFDERGRVAWSRWWRRGAAWAALACVLWLIAYPVLVTIYLVPNARHATLTRTLTLGRHLPLPGAHRLDWLLAGMEYARGGDAVANADRILAESRAAEHPWTLYLRGWISDDPARAERFFRRALEVEPDHYPALEMLLWIRRSRGDLREASELEARLVAARPWKADAIRAGELLPTRRADEWNLDAATSFPPASWLPR